jgi:hypothetical protein
MSPEEKKKYIEKVQESASYENEDYAVPTVKIKAKRPGCGDVFDAIIEVAYLDCVMPRIKCDKYPGCIEHLDDFYDVPLSQAGWEAANRAYI